jgi:cell division protein FtsL
MKKILTISLIFFLILVTSIIKNSTKKIDDEIFVLKENIHNLNTQLETRKLEFNYLSSAEKLIDYQNQYFENELKKKNLNEIKILSFENKNIKIQKIQIINEN